MSFSLLIDAIMISSLSAFLSAQSSSLLSRLKEHLDGEVIEHDFRRCIESNAFNQNLHVAAIGLRRYRPEVPWNELAAEIEIQGECECSVTLNRVPLVGILKAEGEWRECEAMPNFVSRIQVSHGR